MKFKKTKGSYICSSLTFYVQYFYIIYEFVEHVSYTISFQTLRHSFLAINYIQFFSFSKLQSSSCIWSIIEWLWYVLSIVEINQL